MKLEFPDNPVETSANFKTKSFGFGDARVIITILRSKMYSDPIKAICQEVMSNSLDANREAGRADVPIKVKLPNSFDESIHFIDSGPGITPDRMSNVFIKYGNSTKRQDNDQHGGFGLGAKTPFAYTDTFNITTVTQEGDKRFKRRYVAYIDKTQIGSLSQVSEQETTDETGTAISLGVKTKDIQSFVDAVRRVADYWDIRPIVSGHPNFEWREHKYLYEGDNWKLEKGGGAPTILIDGIQYKLNCRQIDSSYSENYYYPSEKEHTLLKHPVRLFFDVGELKVTANREDLDYQPEVIELIKKRLKKAFDELEREAEKTISGADNLWDASILWHSGFSEFRKFINNPTWNGKALIGNLQVGWNQEDKVRIQVFEYDQANYSVNQVKQWRRYVRNINVDDDTLLVEHDNVEDEKRPNRLRLMTLFEQNPSKSRIGVVTFVNEEGRKAFQKNYNWDNLNATLLSSADKKVLPPKIRAKKARAPISKVKELKRRNGRSGYVYEWKPSQVQLDDPDGGVYVIIKNGKALVNDKPVNGYYIWKIKNLLDIDVLGIQYKYRNKIGPQWDTLTTYSANELLELTKDPDILDYEKYGVEHAINNHYSSYCVEINNLRHLIEKPDSLFIQYYDASQKGIKGNDKAGRLKELQIALGITPVQSKNGLKAVHKLFGEKYPLIEHVSSNYWYSAKKKEEITKEIIYYINAKDKE